ncbi:hypothetical protein [Motiliproteus sediminis]|uniref:hypothetical protein n=1 Tax=Motiliproteus sediminis TaxID=1468178 RepID=UPI001AEF7FA8|nr:hypothetical protein [Motiliproteus sediminis]
MYGQSAADATTLMALQTVGFPLLAALLGIGVAVLLQRKDRALSAFVGLSLLLAVGFWGAAGWMRGRWGIPPQQAMDVLAISPWLLLASEWVTLRYGWRRVISVSAVAGLVGWLLWPILARGGWLTGCVLVGVILLLAFLAYTLANSDDEGDFWVIWPASAALVAPLIALDGSLLLAQLGGVVATLLGASWLASRLLSNLPLPVLLPAGVVTLLYSAAHSYANTDLRALLLPLGAMLVTGLLLRLSGLANRWAAVILLLLAGGAAAGAGAWLVWPQEPMY